MKKNLFLSKNTNKIYLITIYILILIILIYFISFYFFSNKKYFIIKNSSINNFYIIPEDKEGEKVKFVNKKSINNLIIDNQKKIIFKILIPQVILSKYIVTLIMKMLKYLLII